MAGYGYIREALSQKKAEDLSNRLTIGRVVDTNDPQQMGRVRAFCPGFGDNGQLQVKQLPWAMYVSPLGGIVERGSRGVDESEVGGPVAYGMWNVPKVGAYVLVGLVDGDPSMRFYAGCIHPQYMTHTMPHGRYTWSVDDNGLPDGPLDTLEGPIQPLYDSFTEHFTKRGDKHAPGTPSDPRRNLEWRTRGVDNQTSALANIHVEHEQDGPGSEVADHAFGNFEFTTITEEDGTERVIRGPGYGVDQQRPDDNYSNTNGVNYDSLIYSWTTPGFHSIAMDDRHENSRIRIRTTAGHQIIMDDTNERIYINTAGGESWIEIDQVGNIDVYASNNVSTHAGGDINFFADKTFRVQAKEGIHFQTDGEYRLHALNDIHVRSEANMRMHAVQSLFAEADQEIHIVTGSTLYLTAGSNVESDAGGDFNATAGGEWNMLASSDVTVTGSAINLNGPPAAAAASGASATESEAYWTSRVPEHEPWARVFMKKSKADQDQGNAHELEFSYDSTEVGRGSLERNESYERNDKWHR